LQFLPSSLTQSPGFMLAWVADIATSEYEQALATLHILGILSLLERQGAMVQARLGDLLRIAKPVIVELLNDLEAMKLLERRAHPSDGRAFEIHLLEAGVKRIEQAKAISEAATSRFFTGLSPTERQLFHDMLSRLASDHQTRRMTAARTEEQ
jgi:MarR family transcriptional regulator, lower aerobic nicotinate degradation pathway regulator